MKTLDLDDNVSLVSTIYHYKRAQLIIFWTNVSTV